MLTIKEYAKKQPKPDRLKCEAEANRLLAETLRAHTLTACHHSDLVRIKARRSNPNPWKIAFLGLVVALVVVIGLI